LLTPPHHSAAKKLFYLNRAVREWGVPSSTNLAVSRGLHSSHKERWCEGAHVK